MRNATLTLCMTIVFAAIAFQDAHSDAKAPIRPSVSQARDLLDNYYGDRSNLDRAAELAEQFVFRGMFDGGIA